MKSLTEALTNPSLGYNRQMRKNTTMTSKYYFQFYTLENCKQFINPLLSRQVALESLINP